MDTGTDPHSTATLYMSMELSNKDWKLAFSAGAKERRVSVPYGARRALLAKVPEAKEKLGLPHDAQVRSCYEAGRDGFWIHRWLLSEGIENIVIDPASIEVNRRRRRAKTDRLDAHKMVLMLLRYYQLGERALWKVVHVPSEADEDARRPERELSRLKKERTGHVGRMKALLATQGIKLTTVYSVALDTVRDWKGDGLGEALMAELTREQQRLKEICAHIKELEHRQAEALSNPQTTTDRTAAKLSALRGVGPVSARTLSTEFFAWRQFRNVRQVGALAGLTGTPYDSGDSVREQGISKAGNRRVRALAIELAWSWLRYQPDSELAKWFTDRFAHGSARMRRVGIVALARKLLVALWKYLQFDQLPCGAVLQTP